MTRTELVEAVHGRHGGMSRRECQRLVDLILRLIRDRLAAGERVEIAGFGSFEVRSTAPRIRRHPVTGRTVRVAGGRSLVFRPSRVLKRELNSQAS